MVQQVLLMVSPVALVEVATVVVLVVGPVEPELAAKAILVALAGLEYPMLQAEGAAQEGPELQGLVLLQAMAVLVFLIQ